MASAEEESKSYPLAAWRVKLQKIDGGDKLARQLQENPDPYAVARSLNLPVPQYIKPPSIGTFVKNSEQELHPLTEAGIVNFYVGLRPVREGLQKFRNDEEQMALEDIVPYIKENISPHHYADYSLRVAEFAVGVCGTIIVTNPSGSIYMDMIMGDVGPLATGKARAEYKARTDEYGVLRYTYVDPYGTDNLSSHHDKKFQLPEDHPVVTPDLRWALGSGIKRIPIFDDGMRDIKLPGRYEMVIVDHKGLFVPLFVDATPIFSKEHPFFLPEEPLYP